MRNLEALSLIVATGGIVWSLIATPARGIQLAIAVGWLAIAIIQAIFEGARVHLLPTYALGGVLAALAWWQPRRRARLVVAVPVVADVRRVLDFLEGLDRKDPRRMFDGRLALDRIGYLGASFGGSVVVEALTAEPRIKAGVAEDGKPYFFDHTLTDLRAPLLYLQSELPYIPVGDAQLASWGVTQAGFAAARTDHYDRLARLVASARGPFYDVLIRGTNHVSFSDLHFLLRFPDHQLAAPRHTHRIINAYTIAFFERYLADTPSPLVDGTAPSPFQDVAVTVRNVPARLAVTP